MLCMLLALVAMHTTNAQIFYSGGSTIYISNGGIVFSNGGVELAQSTAFTNEGKLTVTKNSTFPAAGNFILNTTSVASGNGQYFVEQDWINDAQFNAGNSSVELYGNTAQQITSNNNTSTVFNNLTLTGNGTGNNRKKILVNVDASTGPSGVLTINNRELATDTHIFYVLNPAVTAVTNTTTFGSEGFVSSLPSGYFSRVTSSPSAYTFPTGSSVGTVRYRPLELTPAPGALNVYQARLNNTDATADGYDRNIKAADVCDMNTLFYHSIVRASGNSAADIKMHYVNGTDGSWNGQSRWNAAWNDLGGTSTGTAGGFSTVTRAAWNFPDNNHPYILSNTRPLPPSVTCPVICENASGVVFTASGSTGGYQWVFPSSATLVSGQGTSSVTVNWTTGSGYVSVKATGAAGCASLPDSCLPTVLPVPVAGFSGTVDGTGSAFNFQDQSTGASQWVWDFGDGGTSTNQSPFHQYNDPGNYTVTLLVQNAGGCMDKTAILVNVEGEYVFIPNTFTPNADNFNELFRPILKTAKEYSLSIFNRWGELIFSSENFEYGWDGTYGGKPCETGVYVYRLRIRQQAGKEKVYLGHVTLLK